jgi:D-alanyl-D-alanine carboxypeptidase/D-alanyl-D-alanine-endopeptidase (penicillin-binding protein 4)
MLQLVSSGLVGMWLNMAGVDPTTTNPAQTFTWQGLSWLNPPTAVEPTVSKTIEQYLQSLKSQGLDPSKQAIWLRTDTTQLIDQNGNIPVPAASLTKTATTLAALKTWGLERRFDTFISTTGKIEGGVLEGDLVVQGGGDPLFVWEDAIAVARDLQTLGINRIAGNLVIAGNFHMNYKADPQIAGELFKQGLAGQNLPPDLLAWIDRDVNVVKLPKAKTALSTKAPQIPIGGQILITPTPPTNTTPLIRHQSLTLLDIVRQMNIYSNNEVAQILADNLGGAEKVMAIAASTANFPPTEIQIINGSGLGTENRLSPRAVCQIFRTLHQMVQPLNLTIGDLFPVSGVEKTGTMKDRNMPTGTVMKTGTLNEVSALGGVLPTEDRGLVWFVIVNKGTQISKLRQEQDRLLQNLVAQWGKPQPLPLAVSRQDHHPAYFGDPDRNQIILPQSEKQGG